MKFVRLLGLLSLTLLFSFNACTPKEEEDYIGLDTGSNTFVANFEGNAYTASKKEATIVDDYLTVYGETSSGKLMSVRVKMYKYEPLDRNYILNNTSDHYISYDPSSRFDSLVYWSKNNPETFGQSGDVVLTKLDRQYNLVSGEFKTRVYNNFDANDFYYFTQGSFTDVPIVDSLTIAFTGGEITNGGGNTGGGSGGGGSGGGDTGGGDTGGGDTGGGDTGGGDTGGQTNGEFLNCDINGTAFNSSSVTVQIAYGQVQIMNITATQALTLQFGTAVEVGTYVFGESMVYNPQLTLSLGAVAYMGNAESVLVITEKTSEKITGTFTSTVEGISNSSDTRSITNGEFSVNLLQ